MTIFFSIPSYLPNHIFFNFYASLIVSCNVLVHEFKTWMPLICYRLQTIGLSFITAKMKKPRGHFGSGPSGGCGLYFFAGLHRHPFDEANRHAWNLKDQSPETSEENFLKAYFSYKFMFFYASSSLSRAYCSPS